MRVSEDDLRAVTAMIRASGEFDPARHPRYPKGFPKGGRFAPKGVGGSTVPSARSVLQQIRELNERFWPAFQEFGEAVGDFGPSSDFRFTTKEKRKATSRVLRTYHRANDTLQQMYRIWDKASKHRPFWHPEPNRDIKTAFNIVKKAQKHLRFFVNWACDNADYSLGRNHDKAVYLKKEAHKHWKRYHQLLEKHREIKNESVKES
jgi:hypothetical protein